MKTTEENDAPVKAAFGAMDMERLVDEYFSSQARLDPDRAWEHVYLLLLWMEQSTGLAHSHESGEHQPSQSWHQRSLGFDRRVRVSIGASPLAKKIDWLVRRATSEEERGPLFERVRHFLALENNRRCLVDSGFKDVLASIIRRVIGASRGTVYTRCLLEELPDFRPPRQGDEPGEVDLAIVHGRDRKRTIATVQWILRADREERLVSDHDDYTDANESKEPFAHVLVTNEFDPDRLKRVCELQRRDHQVFSRVVHVNTDGLMAAWVGARERSIVDLMRYIDGRRLVSLETWLWQLAE